MRSEMDQSAKYERWYQHLLNWCLAVAAFCALCTSYLPKFAWLFVSAAVVCGLVGAVAYVRKVLSEPESAPSVDDVKDIATASTGVFRAEASSEKVVAAKPDQRGLAEQPVTKEIAYSEPAQRTSNAVAWFDYYDVTQRDELREVVDLVLRYRAEGTDAPVAFEIQRFLDSYARANMAITARHLRSSVQQPLLVRLPYPDNEARQRSKMPKSRMSVEEILLPRGHAVIY